MRKQLKRQISVGCASSSAHIPMIYVPVVDAVCVPMVDHGYIISNGRPWVCFYGRSWVMFLS